MMLYHFKKHQQNILQLKLLKNQDKLNLYKLNFKMKALLFKQNISKNNPIK